MARELSGLLFDHRTIAKERDRVTRGLLGAAADAVRQTTRDLEKELEELTRQAVGGKLWKAWDSTSYPKTGPAQNPVGIVRIKGGPRTQGAIDFFSRPGRIKPKSGRYLAIPLPAAGSRGRLRPLTPEEWSRRTGAELRFVPRRGKPPLLVADGRIGGSGRFSAIRAAPNAAAQRRGYSARQTTVPIFVLVPQVAFANRLAIEPAVRETGERMRARFLSAAAAIK